MMDVTHAKSKANTMRSGQRDAKPAFFIRNFPIPQTKALNYLANADVVPVLVLVAFILLRGHLAQFQPLLLQGAPCWSLLPVPCRPLGCRSVSHSAGAAAQVRGRSHFVGEIDGESVTYSQCVNTTLCIKLHINLLLQNSYIYI